MRKYNVRYACGIGYCTIMECNGSSKRVSFWYKSLARLNRYWGVKNGIRFKSVKDVIYK